MFQKLFKLGLTDIEDDVFIHRESRQIMVVNALAFLMAPLAYLFAPLFYSFDQPMLATAAVVTSLFFIFCIVLNYFKLFFISKLLMMLNLNGCIFYFSCTLGEQAGAQFIYFVFITLPLLVFTPEERSYSFLFSILAAFFLALLYYLDFSVGDFSILQLQLMDPMHQRTTFYLVLFCAVCFIFAAVQMFYMLTLKAESQLEETNTELEAALIESKERKLMLEKVSQQAAFTSMTMGIAHEIRNPMFSMVTSTEVLEELADEPEEVKEYASMVKRNIFRILKITDLMLRYGKNDQQERKLVNIKDTLDDILALVKGQAKQSNVDLNLDVSSDSQIEGDSSQIYQVFMNLILNALQAMDKTGGKIDIELSESTFIPRDANDEVSAVLVSVTDTGPGISKEKLEKIFDPFFTTKYEGTGLGLSIVLSNVDLHGGLIDVDSKLDEGTRFLVYFPVADTSSFESSSKSIFLDESS